MGAVCENGRRRRVGKARALLVCLGSAVAALGCQTGRSFSDGCPGIYSGVRYYNSQIGELPWDGKIFFAFDLPLSAVFDTVALPATAFLDPERPAEGWVPGCAWADR
jgi:uncharacterized protein YceK